MICPLIVGYMEAPLELQASTVALTPPPFPLVDSKHNFSSIEKIPKQIKVSSLGEKIKCHCGERDLTLF